MKKDTTLPKKESSGDEGFDNAVNAFFHKKSQWPKTITDIPLIKDEDIEAAITFHEQRVKELEEKYGVPYNDGKTRLNIQWDIKDTLQEKLNPVKSE